MDSQVHRASASLSLSSSVELDGFDEELVDLGHREDGVTSASLRRRPKIRPLNQRFRPLRSVEEEASVTVAASVDASLSLAVRPNPVSRRCCRCHCRRIDATIAATARATTTSPSNATRAITGRYGWPASTEESKVSRQRPDRRVGRAHLDRHAALAATVERHG